MGKVRMTLLFAEGPLVFCLIQGKAMTVQMFLHSLKGLLNAVIPLQQLAYKDTHLILEVLRGPLLLLVRNVYKIPLFSTNFFQLLNLCFVILFRSPSLH